MSLRQSLVAAITLVLVVTLAIGSVLIYRHALAKVETEMRAAIAVGSRIATNAVDDAEEVSDPKRRLRLLVADFDGDRHLKATLVEPDGRVAKVSTVAEPDEAIPGWLIWLLARPPERVEVSLPPLFDGHGRVFLETTSTNEIGEVWDDAKLYFGILGIFSLLVLGLTYVLIGRLLAPLGDLLAAFARIGRGDYEARIASQTGPSELVQLSRGFNDMGERLADMDSMNKRLAAQLETVQEEERAELARDLHDDVSPLLFSVDVDATMIRQLAQGGVAERVIERADAIRAAVGEMKRKVKGILGQLRSGILLDDPLPAMVDNLVEAWRARHPDIAFTVEVPDTSWGANIDGTLHHVIRESVSNALRHGKPRNISILVKERDGAALLLEVTDDGRGLVPSHASKGFGITGMKERISRVGGSLTVENRGGGRGVVVRARVPLADGAASNQNATREEASAV